MVDCEANNTPLFLTSPVLRTRTYGIGGALVYASVGEWSSEKASVLAVFVAAVNHRVVKLTWVQTM